MIALSAAYKASRPTSPLVGVFFLDRILTQNSHI
jgi:hypothetical protein